MANAVGAVPVTAGIETISGAYFDYLNPEAAEVTIEDLAVPLSNICRFAGHLPYFYSVAQHAVNASLIVEPEFALTALLHDTAEAFTNDLPTPLKWAFPAFKNLEVSIESAMARRFGFVYPLPAEVKLADTQMLGLEARYIKGVTDQWAILDGIEFEHLRPLVDLAGWSPRMAETRFLNRYKELTRG